MKRRIKYGKIALVVLLTGLIWIWTDRRLDEEHTLSSATIKIAKSVGPGYWISFNDESSASVRNVELSGPASKIDELKQKLRDGRFKSEFDWGPKKEVMDKSEYDLDVLDFIRGRKEIKELGLAVQSCEPRMLEVKVQKLVSRTLTIECRDENGRPLRVASIKPPTVNMAVPEYWQGEKLAAYVDLKSGDVKDANAVMRNRNPYIELAPGEKKYAEATVDVTMPPKEDLRGVHTITATVGFVFSANLQGRYTVKLNNEAEVRRDISIRATPAARQAYEREPFKIILYILDDDRRTTEEREREVVYIFPEEYVRKGEITLNQPKPVTAKFQVIPVPAASPP